jgi:cytochrome c oxidase subunit 2
MRRLLWLGGLAIVAGACLALPALLGPDTASASPLTPASPQARLSSDLFWITIGIAVVVLVAVEFLLIYTSLRFRRQPGLDLDAPEPVQIHGNTRLEAMWTILPAVILVSLFIISVRAMAEVGSVPADAMKIQVTGRQFLWQFSYPDANVTTTNDLRVPVGQAVDLEVTSQDVIHSFWVPDLGGKVDANPGLVNHMSWVAEKAGVYRGVCAELCGAGHASMLFTVTAMEPDEFKAWLAAGGQGAPAGSAVAGGGTAAAPAGNPDAGKALFTQNGCAACHAVQGDTKIVGPSLAGVAQRAGSREPGVSANDYIRQSIREPSAFIVPGFPGPPSLMPPFAPSQVSDDDLNSIISYLLTLK